MSDTLPLRVRGPAGGSPVLLSNLTRASSISDLMKAVRNLLMLHESKSYILMSGFPPKTLFGDNHDRPLGVLLQPNEVVTVKEDGGEEPRVLQGHGLMKQKRGVKAKGASGPAKKENSRCTDKNTVSKAALVVNAGPRIRTLHRQSGNGTGGPGTGGENATRKRRRMDVGVSNEEDLGELLLASVGKGGGGGRVGRCMRAVFRKAVEKNFDEAKAAARVAAVQGGRYSAKASIEERRLDGSCARLHVLYHKGHGFQSDYRDDVELLSQSQLLGVVRSVLADVDGREMLKPANMAGCSPRVFWSLMHHFNANSIKGGGQEGLDKGTEAALRWLVPEQDWAFLHERHRKLSDKAKENQAQEEELQREREEEARRKRMWREARGAGRQRVVAADAHSKGKGRKDPASGRTTSVGDTIDQAGTPCEEAVSEVLDRERRAQAAVARSHSFHGAPAQIVEAARKAEGREGGRKEMEERASLVAVDGESGEIDSDFPEEVSDAWVRVLRSPSFMLLDCAALAGADAEELVLRLQKHHAAGAKPLAPSDPSLSEVQGWVSACQNDELDEMMMRLAGGDEDLLEAMECVHVATPKDVRLWGMVPGAFLDMLARELSEEKMAHVQAKLPDVEAVQVLKERAEKLMAENAWLESWGSE